MSRSSIKIEIRNANKTAVVERATVFLEEKSYEREKPETEGPILFRQTPGWPAVPKCIELSIHVAESGKTYLKCDGYIPAALFHETFKNRGTAVYR